MSVLPLLGAGAFVLAFGIWWLRLPVKLERRRGALPGGVSSPIVLLVLYAFGIDLSDAEVRPGESDLEAARRT